MYHSRFVSKYSYFLKKKKRGKANILQNPKDHPQYISPTAVAPGNAKVRRFLEARTGRKWRSMRWQDLRHTSTRHRVQHSWSASYWELGLVPVDHPCLIVSTCHQELSSWLNPVATEIIAGLLCHHQRKFWSSVSHWYKMIRKLGFISE